ncbi:MAG: NAD-dependent dehydratase [Bacteroidota bacterium]|nr:NAD-dependent dehydratase [Bacteroidota bacterium]
MKKVLIIGGTNFVGRNIVEQLLKNKSLELCLFNRNKTNTNLFPNLRKITGDRETNDIEKIAEENWDTIVDVSAYYPDSLSRLLQLVSGKTKKYIFISTASVYDFDKFNGTPFKETDQTVNCSETERTDTTMHTYGKRKKACEDLFKQYEDAINYTILRPGIIYGQYDHTDRLYYWIYRIKNNTEILLPETGDFLLNLSFMNDIAESIEYFITHETKNNTYNITTHSVIPFHKILAGIEKALNKKPVYIPITKETIEKEKLSFPLYHGNLLQIDNSKILKEFHFHFSELENSLKNTVQFYALKNYPLPQTGISLEEEQKIIQQLK